MKNKICELLAPAGNLECALAAIDAGADAIYCGLGRFNARCRAENFDNEKLGALLEFIHSKGRKLYLTFNTLLFEDELEGAGEMLSDLVQLAPDALIVHDPGVIRMAKKYFPSLTIHASTQMGIHNSAGVRAMAAMGVERVILERPYRDRNFYPRLFVLFTFGPLPALSRTQRRQRQPGLLQTALPQIF